MNLNSFFSKYPDKCDILRPFVKLNRWNHFSRPKAWVYVHPTFNLNLQTGFSWVTTSRSWMTWLELETCDTSLKTLVYRWCFILDHNQVRPSSRLDKWATTRDAFQKSLCEATPSVYQVEGTKTINLLLLAHESLTWSFSKKYPNPYGSLDFISAA